MQAMSDSNENASMPEAELRGIGSLRSGHAQVIVHADYYYYLMIASA
jgi:hypothetical protein